VLFPDIDPPGTAPERVPDARRPAAPRPGPEDEAAAVGHIQTTAISFRTIHRHGDMLVRYLEARRAIFIDRLHWRISQADGMEFDQYDTPAATWVVVHEFGTVIGGVRLLPTTAQCGFYSYMLRDAQRGILDDIPTDVLFIEAPVDAVTWEASRFFITEDVPAARRTTVQRILFDAMARAAEAQGATRILGIVPSIWSRWARRIGAGATPIGARFAIDGTWSQAVLFDIRTQGFGRAS
jgi:N-acyl-L-homoserine lactone synthetase